MQVGFLKLRFAELSAGQAAFTFAIKTEKNIARRLHADSHEMQRLSAELQKLQNQ